MVPACETPGKPTLLTVTQATDAIDRPGGRARGVRDPRQVRRGVAVCTAVVVVGITIAISGGGRGVRADTGSAQGSVSGTGAFFDGSVTQTVTVNADTSNLGAFSISDGTSSSNGDVTCLFISGSGAVFGAHLNFGGSDLYGLIFITDGGPTGPDTLGLGATSPAGPADCTTSAPPGTSLSSGDFTVFVFPIGSPPPSAAPTPGETPTASGPVPSGPVPSGPPPSGPPTPPGFDGNNDRIADLLQPGGTPPNSFVDASLTPATSGSVVPAADPVYGIVDASDATAGVEITVGSGAPGAQVSLSVCGGFPLYVDVNSFVQLTCGSVDIKVASGSARIVLGGGITVVSIPAGGAARVADVGGGSYTVQNTGPAGSPSVSLTVDGTTSAILPGPPITAGTSDFIGFSQPIDNAPVVNRLKAGQAIPVKWRLLTNTGAPITNLSSATITVTTLDCALGTTIDQVEEVVAGSSGLQNQGNGNYQLNWQSPKSYAGSCKTLHLNVHDGVTHDARFQFTK